MTRDKYNKILFASFVIVWSIFLSVVWTYFRDSGLMYRVPFLDISQGHNELSFISWDVAKADKKAIPFWELFPFLVQMFYVFIYFYLYRYVGDMIMIIKGAKYDIWNYQMFLLLILFVDYCLTHRQTPFRESIIFASIIIQVVYVVWSYKELLDTTDNKH